MSKKTLSTDKLIHSIKLRASIPETQNSFKEEDFLYFINEEMDLGIVPHVMSHHEDYFLFTEDIDIVRDVNRYEIPHRAVGNKLRDVSYLDGQNQYEMTRIQVEDLSDLYYSFNESSVKRFYIEGSEIVISDNLARVGNKLRVSYYLRPNAIVSEDDVAIVTNVDRNKGLVSISQYPERFDELTEFDIVSSKSSFKLISKEISPDGLPSISNLNFTFGTSKIVNFTYPAYGTIVNSDYISIVDNSSGSEDLFIFWYDIDGLGVAPLIANATITRINCVGAANNTDILNATISTVNSVFSDSRIIASSAVSDVLTIQNGGNGVSVGDNFDVEFNGFTVVEDVESAGTMTIPTKLGKNDVISAPEETIIPQVPVELHAMLAQRCAMRCLESMNDTQGLQAAAAKLADMEAKTGMLVDNRVESAPLKVVPRHSPIRRRTYNTRR